VFLSQDVSEFQHKLLDWLEDAFRVINLSLPSLSVRFKILACLIPTVCNTDLDKTLFCYFWMINFISLMFHQLGFTTY